MGIIQQAGPFGPVMIVLALVVVVLAVRCALRLSGADPVTGPATEQGINAVLFWGGLAALIGLLGQYSGVYVSMDGITRLENPGVGLIAAGIRESMTPAILGLAILIVAAAAWLPLRARHARVTR